MADNERHIYLILSAQHLLKNRLVQSFRDNGVRITPSHSAILFMLESEALILSDLSACVLHLIIRPLNRTRDRLRNRLRAGDADRTTGASGGSPSPRRP